MSVRVFAVVLLLSTVALEAQAPPAVPNCPELAAALRTVTANDVRLKDWPNLGRYREANRSVKDAQVVFMGDSITDFWQQPRFGGFFANKAYVDRGISGQTTPQMLLRFRADVINFHPAVVVILAGTNDIAGNTGPMTDEEIEGNLASMSELATANNIRVVLASITPVGAYHVANANAVPQTTARPVGAHSGRQHLDPVVRSYTRARLPRLLFRDDRRDRDAARGPERRRPASDRRRLRDHGTAGGSGDCEGAALGARSGRSVMRPVTPHAMSRRMSAGSSMIHACTGTLARRAVRTNRAVMTSRPLSRSGIWNTR